MKDLEIFIPSRGRWDVLKTPYILSEELREKCLVVVRRDEVKLYKEHNPELENQFLVLSPKAARGKMAGARQFILDNSTSRYHFQIDDDLTSVNIKKRCTDYGGLKLATRSQINACFKQMCDWIDTGFAQVSFTDRMTSAFPSNRFYADYGRMAQVLGYNRDILVDENLRFDTIPNHCFEDLDMNLTLLLAGYPCRISRKYSHNHRAEAFRGGCQIYRDDDLKRRVGNKMVKKYPGLIKLCERKDGYVYIKIAWKKVMKEGGLL